MKYIKLFEEQHNTGYTIYDIIVMNSDQADDVLINELTKRHIDYELLELLVNHSNVDINTEFSTHDYPELEDGYETHKTALMIAVERGDYTAIRILLQHPKIDVNVQDNMGISPLHRASFASDYDIVGLLLSRPEIDLTLTEEERYRTAWDLADEEMKEFYPQLNPDA